MIPAREIENQAAEWLVRLESDPSEPQRAECESWLALDPRHRAAFLRLEKGWRRADRLKNLKPLDGEVNEHVLDTFPHSAARESVEPAPPAPTPASRLSRKTVWLAAAAVVALIAIGPIMWFVGSNVGWETYRTELGGFQRVAFQDGSTAFLNTNSEIHVRLGKDRREIVLIRGEALFTVAHDVHRPFDVKAGDTVVRAVGTAFSVRLGEQKQVDVIVTEGRVAIDPPDDSQNFKLAQRIAMPQISTLAAGESVRVNSRKLEVQKIDNENMNRKLAWTQGRLWFDRMSLAEEIAEFNRYNRRQMVIDDPSIADMRFSGAFDATDVDSFVATLGVLGIKGVATRTNQDDQDTEVIHLSGNGASKH
jgi:transmembrane sensor